MKLFDWLNKKIGEVESSVLGEKWCTDVYEDEYAWLPQFLEQIGFNRVGNCRCLNHSVIDYFGHASKGLSVILAIEFSSRRRTWDVINLRLSSNLKPYVEKRWNVWRSSLNEQQLEDEVQQAIDAFVKVEVTFAGEDDNEPIYLVRGFSRPQRDEQGRMLPRKPVEKPTLRGEAYRVSDDERWIHAKSLGQLYVDAHSLGATSLSDIRQVKVEAGLWDGVDKNGRRTGGIMWKDEYGGVVKM